MDVPPDVLEVAVVGELLGVGRAEVGAQLHLLEQALPQQHLGFVATSSEHDTFVRQDRRARGQVSQSVSLDLRVPVFECV